MSEPLVLVVLLGSSIDSTEEAMLAAVRRALGPDATVLADTSAIVTDEEALLVADRAHARAVARVIWDPAAKVARLHVHVDDGEWSNDEITFAPQDESSEKGRTVGYALASMVQRIEREHEAPAAKSPPAPPEPAPPPAPVEPPPPPPRPFEAFAHGVAVLGGDASALGGGAGARYFLGPLGFGARGAIRAGRIDAADASTMTVVVAGGPAYRLTLGSFDVGARAELELLRHAVTRNELTRARWIGAFAGLIDLGWAPSAGLRLSVSAGPEVTLGTTSVAVGGSRMGELPTVRAVAELGGTVRF